MLVQHILREKGRDVVTIPGEAMLSEAARLLARRRIGAVIVRDGEGGVSGILSERDIVRAVALHSVAALGHSVTMHMTREVSTCGEADTVDELMETMTSGRFRHMPVLDDDGRLCGIVSIGDVVKTRIEETVREATSLREYIVAG